jgi:hypothetical protein
MFMSIIKNDLMPKIQAFLYGMESKIRNNAVEYHLKQSAQQHPLDLKDGKSSEIIRFLQYSLSELDYDVGAIDGVFSPDLMNAINLFVPKKKKESVDVTEYIEGGHKALTLVTGLHDITANHIAAVADSLNDAGKMSFAQPETLKQYCAALKEVPDEMIASIVQDLEKEIHKKRS